MADLGGPFHLTELIQGITPRVWYFIRHLGIDRSPAYLSDDFDTARYLLVLKLISLGNFETRVSPLSDEARPARDCGVSTSR
jgi:hypothetical protein